jgi:hypothetical protein
MLLTKQQIDLPSTADPINRFPTLPNNQPTMPPTRQQHAHGCGAAADALMEQLLFSQQKQKQQQ